MRQCPHGFALGVGQASGRETVGDAQLAFGFVNEKDQTGRMKVHNKLGAEKQGPQEPPLAA